MPNRDDNSDKSSNGNNDPDKTSSTDSHWRKDLGQSIKSTIETTKSDISSLSTNVTRSFVQTVQPKVLGFVPPTRAQAEEARRQAALSRANTSKTVDASSAEDEEQRNREETLRRWGDSNWTNN